MLPRQSYRVIQVWHAHLFETAQGQTRSDTRRKANFARPVTGLLALKQSDPGVLLRCCVIALNISGEADLSSSAYLPFFVVKTPGKRKDAAPIRFRWCTVDFSVGVSLCDQTLELEFWIVCRERPVTDVREITGCLR